MFSANFSTPITSPGPKESLQKQNKIQSCYFWLIRKICNIKGDEKLHVNVNN